MPGEPSDLSAHRTRSNRRIDSSTVQVHPATVAEIDDAMRDIVEDKD